MEVKVLKCLNRYLKSMLVHFLWIDRDVRDYQGLRQD